MLTVIHESTPSSSLAGFWRVHVFPPLSSGRPPNASGTVLTAQRKNSPNWSTPLDTFFSVFRLRTFRISPLPAVWDNCGCWFPFVLFSLRVLVRSLVVLIPSFWSGFPFMVAPRFFPKVWRFRVFFRDNKAGEGFVTFTFLTIGLKPLIFAGRKCHPRCHLCR